MMPRRMGVAVMALFVMCTWFGGWESDPAPAAAPGFLAVAVADAAPRNAPRYVVEPLLDPWGDPDGFSDGPGGDPDGTPPDSTSKSPQQGKSSRGLGVVAQAILVWVARLL